MNEDYLWDKSGEPDPEIQQLEEILGTLRYQPKPLRLAPRRNYWSWLAIAATVVVALLAVGLWIQVQHGDASISPVAIASSPKPVIGPRLSAATEPPAKRKPVIVRHNRQEAEEALAAKQQLMFALRLASEKLNSAYRRTQTPTQIKNQHRAG
jgi:hypothetical protein